MATAELLQEVDAKPPKPTKTYKWLRCSSLPLHKECPASAYNDGFKTASSGEAALLGTAVHEVLTSEINGTPTDIDVIAKKHCVSLDDLYPMVAAGWRIWSSVSGHFPNPICEISLHAELGGAVLAGRLDVLSVGDDEVRIADFKTGWADEDHWAQLAGYAFLAMEATGKEAAYGSVLRLRDQIVDGRRWTKDEARDEVAGIVARVLKGESVFQPGRQCRYCSRSLTCEAKTAMLRQGVEVLSRETCERSLPIGLPIASPDRGIALRETLDRIKTMEEFCAALRDGIRADVAAHGGWMPAGDGLSLRIKQAHQKKIDFASSWPILSEVVPDERLNDCFMVTKTKVEEAVRAQAARGQKKAAVERLLAELDVRGAITTKVVERLEVSRDGGQQRIESSDNGDGESSGPVPHGSLSGGKGGGPNQH